VTRTIWVKLTRRKKITSIPSKATMKMECSIWIKCLNNRKLFVNAIVQNVYSCTVNAFQKVWYAINNVHVINVEIIICLKKKELKQDKLY
jgi:hypothetical protein